MINAKELVPFLIENNLTIEEYFLLHLKHTHETKLLKQYKAKFQNEEGTLLSASSKAKLIKAGYLKEVDGKPNHVTVGDKFAKHYINEFDAGNEFWNNYPGFTKIDGKNVPLMKADRAAFRKLYFETIKGSQAEHLQIIEDLKYGVKHGLISMNIVNFVRSEAWLSIRKERVGEVTNLAEAKFDENEF